MISVKNLIEELKLEDSDRRIRMAHVVFDDRQRFHYGQRHVMRSGKVHDKLGKNEREYDD